MRYVIDRRDYLELRDGTLIDEPASAQAWGYQRTVDDLRELAEQIDTWLPRDHANLPFALAALVAGEDVYFYGAEENLIHRLTAHPEDPDV